MDELRAVDLEAAIESLRAAGQGRGVLWQDAQSIAFLSHGRPGRLDFHIDPSAEITLQLRGEQHLHYITPEGEQKVALIRASQILLCPGGVPHSPRVSDDAWFLVLERVRAAGEEDRFLWYCEACGEKIYETGAIVGNYRDDPVSQVHARFYADEALRTCPRCGWVVPRPG